MSAESTPGGVSGRVEHQLASDLAKGTNTGISCNDSHQKKETSRAGSMNLRKTARGYITRTRARHVAEQLKPRQYDLLSTIAKLNVATGHQLAQLREARTASKQRLLRSDLAELVNLRVLARLDRRIGGARAGSDGYVYALDLVGQRIIRPDRGSYRAPWTPQPSHLGHALAVSQLYVDLQLSSTTLTRLARFDAEPAAWRTFHGPGGARLVLKPDGFVIIAGPGYEDRAFVEIDRATESLPRIIHKAKTYIAYYQSGREQAADGVFPLVHWIAPHQLRAECLGEALSRLPAEHWRLFTVSTDQDAVNRLISGTHTPLDTRCEAAS